MTRIASILLLALATAACSDEPPAASPATDSRPAAAAPAEQAEAPASDAAGKAAAEDPVAVAEAMDEAETGAPGAEPVQLAEVDTGDEGPSPYQEGQHYRSLPVAQPTSVSPGKIEVVEVFWYGCPHCFSLEPHLREWAASEMPETAELVRIPATLNRNWQVHARVYYTAEALGVLDQVHDDLFHEINVNRNPLMTQEALLDFFGAHGVSEQAFLDAFNSIGVQTRLRQADSLIRRYRITGVPAMVVNGKYVTGADMAGGIPQLFDVVEFLIRKEGG